jgi:hypothetical protein
MKSGEEHSKLGSKWCSDDGHHQGGEQDAERILL